MAVVAGVVLAAGASTRMGRPKMLLPIARGTVLSSVVTPLLEAGLSRIVVVLGHEADVVRRGAGLPDDPRLAIVVNECWRDGMASSLQRGLEACGEAEGALVALGDQPGLSSALVRRLLSAAPGAALVVPVRGDRAGHPVLFARSLWDELRALRGDVGGRDVVRRHWNEAALVEGEPLPDLDTEEDYRALVEGRPGRADEGMEAPRRL